jgi:peptidyl-prolyl cis-trans isomerase C
MKKRNYLTVAALLSGIALSFAACSKDISKSNQVLARVGDKEITNAYLERQVADLPETVRESSMQGEGKKAIVEGLVDREILYTAAVKKKLDKSVDLKRKFEDLRKELVIKTYLENELGDRVKVEESEVQAYYNNHPTEYQHREEVRVSQIVVADEARSREILDKLSIKREFGELAATYSTDQATAAHQGDVGWFSYAKLPVEVRDGIFKLGNGEVSKPFKTAGGYEIYKVTDRRTLSFPLEKVKDAIRAQIFAEKSEKEVKAVVEGLKKDVVVQYNEQLLK